MNTQTQEALKMAIEAMEMAMEADWELNKSHVFNILHSITICKEALAQLEKNTLYLPVKIDKHGFIFNMQSLFDAGIEGKFKIKLEVCDE